MNTRELIAYYAGLLIIQYIGKPKAFATVQTQATPIVMPQTTVDTIAFDAPPTSGAFTLTYNGETTASIAYNDSAGTIQTKLRALTGLSDITVTGSISGLLLTVTFIGIDPPALELTVGSSTLQASGDDVTITITEIDETLPLAVQNGFNLVAGTTTAVGVQLNTLGKYVGVSRSSVSIDGTPITLDDADFLSLIRMAIVRNSAGSSLSVIQDFLDQFFPGQILVYDYQNMHMSYFISSTIGSQDLADAFIAQGLLPKPMGVRLTISVSPTIDNFFGFRTYTHAAANASPFNDYADYQTDWPWFSYAYAVT
jgi:hypothetical protein